MINLQDNQIIEKLKNGNAIPARGPIPPQLVNFSPSSNYEYNPLKARELLQQAGYLNGIDIQLWQSQSSNLLYVTEAIQAQLAEVGINVQIIR